MSYIGNSPFDKTARIVSRVTGDGSSSTFYPDGGYSPGYIDVYVDGTKKTETTHFTASNGLSVVFNSAPANNAIVEFILYRPISLNVINWSAINNKPDPEITLGGDATGNVILNDLTSNTLNLTLVSSGVVANSYGNSSQIPVITVDAKGRVTNATTTAVAGVTGFSYTGANNTFSITTGDGSTFAANISANSIAALALGSTGVVANTYGNSTAIPVLTVDEDGRISNATTTSVSGVTGVSYTAANSTITVSTSISNYDAPLTSGNSSVQGLLKVVDSVANSSADVAASANSVKVAYELAGNAVSNATSYAATAYSNAVATASSDATSKAATAYSNAVATASSDATSKAATAYSNAVSTAAADATSKAATAYSNAASYADTAAATAYSNAVSQATSLAGNAYSNATTFASNASNISSGTLSGSRVQANNGIVANSSGVFVNPGTGVTVNATGVHIGQNVANTANVAFSNMVITGNLTVQGTTTTVNTVTLSVQDNMIYLNANSVVTNPDLGFAGNYNDGTYAHAGFFRDASDARWKIFDSYQPEPDASAYIDTANTSFHLSDFQANVVYANLTGNVTGNVSGSANSATYLGGNTAADLRSYTDTVAGTSYSNATTFASNASNITTGTLATARLPATANITTAVNIGANVNLTTSSINVGNATVNTNISAAAITINGVNVNTAITGNAATAYSNATAYSSNADNITSGTLTTARLPATANISTAINVGANVNLTTTSINVGNATINTNISAAAITINGVNVNTAITGNAATAYANAVSTAATDASSKAATAYTNATSYAASIAGTAYSNATTYSSNANNLTSGTVSPARLPQANSTSNGAVLILDSVSNTSTSIYAAAPNSVRTAYELAGNAVSNAVSYAATAYSNATTFATTSSQNYAANAYANAIAYAASNTYVNTTFLKLSGGTMSGNVVSSGGMTAWNTTTPGVTLGNFHIGVSSVTSGAGGGITFGARDSNANTNAMAGIYTTGGGSFGTRMYFATTDDYGVGSKTALYISEAGVVSTQRSYFQATGSARAPIFYDSDDTGYYGDFNNGGVKAWRNSGYSGGISVADSGGYLTYRITTNNHADGWQWQFTTQDITSGSGTKSFWVVYSGSDAYAAGSMRAPIFYDSDDTGYYVNPNSTSKIRKTNLIALGAGWDDCLNLYSSDATNRWNFLVDSGASNALRIAYNNSEALNITTSRNVTCYVDVRAPIFYDYNDTNYYVDPASTTVLNALNAITKSFLIDHPTKQGKKLRYACLEGPENGVYVRGKLTKENTIELPEYWTKLVDPDSITVSLTPIGKGQKLSVLDISNNQVVIEEEDSKDINCFYVVYGERVDVDKLEVEV